MTVKMTQCPKCLSEEVFLCQQGVGWDPRVGMSMKHAGMMLQTGNWTTCLCTDCGYFENYITEPEWLNKIKTDPSGCWQRSQ